MSNLKKRLVSVLTVGMLLGLSVGGLISIGSFWLLSKMAPELMLEMQNQIASKSTIGQLKLLGDTFSGYSTFRSEGFQAALKQQQISLDYENEFNQAKRAELLNQGKAELLVTTLDQFLQYQPQGKIVGLIDHTVGADAVVLNTKQYSTLTSLLDLTQLLQQPYSRDEQLSITFAGDTPSEYLALILSTKFEAFNLSKFRLKRVVDASEAWKLLQDPSQSIAVAILWEPYVTQARNQGYKVILSSKDTPEAIVDVIVASNRLLESQPEKVSSLLAAYYRRIDGNISDASQLQNQIAEDSKLSPSQAATVLQGIEFFTAVEAKDWLTDGTLSKRITSTAEVLKLAGKLNQLPENPQELFSPKFITEAAANTQTLISLVGSDNPKLADRLAGKGKVIAPNTLNQSQIAAGNNIGNLRVPGNVEFNTGSAQLTDKGKQTLNQLAQDISEFNMQTVAVRIIGHTSKTGSIDFNQELSKQRAQMVVKYLRSRGIRHNIMAEGKGYSQPLPGITPTNPRNQRTEIRLVHIN